MYKVLMVASVASTIDQFNMNNIRLLQEQGCKVDIACNFDYGNNTSNERLAEFKEELSLMNVDFFNILFPRSIFSILQLITSYNRLKALIIDNDYQIIHCHSPIGGVICRLACKRERSQGLKIIYTVHGFHFYRNAPLLNWLVYFPIEYFCSYFTDILITINNEDYKFAKKIMKSSKVYYLPGIGVDIKKIASININLANKKKELGIDTDSVILLSVGELNKNKNHKIIVKAMSLLRIPNLHYFIAGKGSLYDYILKLANKLGIENNIHLLGYRKDIFELLKISDIFCFPSFREGLPVSVLEAMASALPLIASNIRGVNDCCQDQVTGITCSPTKVNDFSLAIKELVNNTELRKKMGKNCIENIKKFDIINIEKTMKKIYREALYSNSQSR